MKKLEIIIRPERLDDLKAILNECDAHGLMITNIMGYGIQRGHKREYNGIDFGGNLLPKVKVETIVSDEISEEISKMTLDEKIGQMLMVGIDGTEVDDDFKEFAEEYKFGTVILFGKNITSAEQLVNLTNSIKSTAGDIPYIIGMDEEGGLVTRLPDDVLSMPSALTIADSEDTEYCYNAGYSSRCNAGWVAPLSTQM